MPDETVEHDIVELLGELYDLAVGDIYGDAMSQLFRELNRAEEEPPF